MSKLGVLFACAHTNRSWLHACGGADGPGAGSSVLVARAPLSHRASSHRASPIVHDRRPRQPAGAAPVDRTGDRGAAAYDAAGSRFAALGEALASARPRAAGLRSKSGALKPELERISRSTGRALRAQRPGPGRVDSRGAIQ